MKKYAKGGYEDMSSMTMEDVADMRARAKAEKAYNRAMPDPYEEGDSKEKRRAALDNAINAPIDMAKKAVSKVKNFADSTEGKRLGMAAKLAVESSMPYQSMRPGLAAAEYGIDKLKEELKNANVSISGLKKKEEYVHRYISNGLHNGLSVTASSVTAATKATKAATPKAPQKLSISPQARSNRLHNTRTSRLRRRRAVCSCGTRFTF
jgi:hypothetical protein